ncbi:MAG: carboxypeptidase-like regulatory domain-containing protein, partial [Bacteroidales bacterium]|nr:carboxypeptidase-like regulatory domain-containing protein [Bacteroidales bacterium]
LDTKGITVNKTVVREQLTTATLKLSRALAAYASLNSNYQLLSEVNYTLSTLNKSRDNIFYDIAVLIQTKAKQYEVDLANFLIKPEDITGQQALIDQYIEAVPEKRVAVVTSKTSTADLKLKIREMDVLLKEKLDRLILLFEAENSDFVQQYFNARIIIDLGHRSTNNKTIISGLVTGFEDEKPIDAVHVWIVETGQSFNTGSDGHFEFTLEKPGEYVVKAEKTGYKTYTSDQLKVEEGHELTLDVDLEPTE